MIGERESLRVSTSEKTTEKTSEKPKKTGKNKALLIGSSVVGAGLAIAGGVWGVPKILSEEDTSLDNTHVRSEVPVGSFSNSFNNANEEPQLLATKANPLGIPVTKNTEPETKPQTETTKATLDEAIENIATKGVVKESMIERLPQKEIYGLFPDAFAKLRSPNGSNIITLPFKPTYEEHVSGHGKPDIQVEVGGGKNTLQLEYPLDLRQSADPNAEITVTKTFTGQEPRVREKFQGEGYYDTLHFGNVPNGTIIRLPLDGFTSLFESNTEDPDKTPGNTIDTAAPNGDYYKLSITAYEESTVDLPDPRNAQRASVLEDLADTPLSDLRSRHYPIGSYGKQSFRGSPVLKVNSPEGKPVEIVLQLLTALKKKGGKTPVFSDAYETPFVLTNLELLTTPEGKFIASGAN